MAEAHEGYFEYVDDLVDEMHELFFRHKELEDDYSAAMAHIRKMGWHALYATHVQERVEGDSVGDSSD